MTTIIITEKTSQKKDLAAAIGTEYGQIFPAEGHLLSLQEPQSVNEQWGKWSFDLLKPDEFYPTCVAPDGSPSARGKLEAIANALKKADKVILATDCDREGQLIGEELLRHYEFTGPVGRAIFTAQDEKTLRQSFQNLEPNENYFNLGQAAMVRQQADQVYNLSLTRAATVALKRPGEYGAIGIGRVKTPTMAIVCIRELEILDFNPSDYFHIVATAGTTAGALQLRYAPKEKILKPEEAERFRAAAEGFEGPLSAVKKIKRTKPPKLLDLPELQKICSRKWGWSATKTLEVAQELYDGSGKKIQTYPRAESRYLAENQIDDVDTIIQGLKNLDQYSNLDISEPQIRKGKSGHFSDAGLKGVSHHAIVPNKNTMDQIGKIYPRLSADEQKMFDLVASSYLAILMPDYVYESSTIAMDVPGPDGQTLNFKITGNIPKEQGWKSVFTDEMEKKEDHAGELPPVQDGDIAKLSPVELDTKKTKAPPRFNEGTLIDAMQNAWRFVEDKTVQERLKEAKGIGTPATRAAIITGLKRQNFITQSGKHIVPTPSGLTLYKTLKATAPELVDPGVTAQWEMKLDDVLVGKQTARQVWDEIGDATARLISVLQENMAKAPKISTGVAAPKGATKFGSGKPTDKMIATAQSVASKKGAKLPKKFDTDFQTCKDFLDEHLGGNPLIAIEKRLGSGIIKGLGPTAAKAVVTAFGTDSFTIIEETPERLGEVKGVGPKIVKAAVERKAVRTIGRQLEDYGVSREFGLRLYKTYGEDTGKVIAEDPYRIVRDIKWFGFNNADRIASNIGLTADAPARARTALFLALDDTMGPKNKASLFERLETRTGITVPILEAALQEELGDKTINEQFKDGIASLTGGQIDPWEKPLAKALKSLEAGAPPWPLMEAAKAIDWAEKQREETLTPEQREATAHILGTKATCLNLSSGVDATPVMDALHRILQAKGISIKLATATYAEAAKLNDGTEWGAEPAAKMLGWNNGSGAFKHTKKKPIDCQFLILHGAEKIDPNLLAGLITALPSDAGLLLIRGASSTGASKINTLLEKTVGSGAMAARSMTEITAAQQNSQKLKTIIALEQGNDLPGDTDPSGAADFLTLAANSPAQASAKMLELITNRLPAKFDFDAIHDIQVVCLSPAGDLGSGVMNQPLQQALNPPKDAVFIDRFGWRYRAGDKVMICEDERDKKLTAGEIGTIKKIDKEGQSLQVSFSGSNVDFQFDELDILSLAYAIPISKASSMQTRAAIILTGGKSLPPAAGGILRGTKDLVILI